MSSQVKSRTNGEINNPLKSFRAVVPNVFGTRDQFSGRQFSTDVMGCFQDDSSSLHYCELYFCYYYISSTSDHQALDLGDGDPCDTAFLERWSGIKASGTSAHQTCRNAKSPWRIVSQQHPSFISILAWLLVNSSMSMPLQW